MDMPCQYSTKNMHLPSSKLQANVARELDMFRRLYLQLALTDVVRELDFDELNAELSKYAPRKELRLLGSLGIRGEFLFPVPLVLRTNPKLLGYYRLLLGYSQKEFFNKGKLG